MQQHITSKQKKTKQNRSQQEIKKDLKGGLSTWIRVSCI